MSNPAIDSAQALVARNFVWDCHGCMPLDPIDESFLPQLDRYRQAGVDFIALNVGFGEHGPEQHLRALARFRRWILANSDRFAITGSVAAIDTARAEGKLAIAFDIEGMNAIADDLSLIGLYYDLGVRWMLMAYNRNNLAAGGCQDNDAGLTAFGRAAIEEMARVGMILCLSHTGERSACEAIDHSPVPVIFSHSNPASRWPHARNIGDAVMKACAARGGVVGINGIGLFLGDNDNSSKTFAAHVDHAVSVVGIEHVGIGLDYVFDGAGLDAYVAAHPDIFPPTIYGRGIRLVAPEQIVEIADELLRLGYDEHSLSLILGLNFQRVAAKVWR